MLGQLAQFHLLQAPQTYQLQKALEIQKTHSSHVEQSPVEPDVNMTPCDQEAPASRKRQIVRDYRMVFEKVRGVERLVEVIALRVLACPHEPTARIPLGWMAKTVQRRFS